MANQSENLEPAGNPEPAGKREPVGKREPAGFTPHSSGLASERAREQGWQTNEEERTKIPQGKQNEDGGTDYDHGARDFGDEPVDTSSGKNTGSDKSSEISTAQPASETPKKDTPTAKPRSKKAA